MDRFRHAARLFGEGGGLVGAVEIAIGADDGCAMSRKSERERAAEAIARAGDDGDLVVEAEEIFKRADLGSGRDVAGS